CRRPPISSLFPYTTLFRSQRPQTGERYALSLSPSSLAEQGFVEWLLARLEQQPRERQRLVLEIPEYTLHYAQAEVGQLTARASEDGKSTSLNSSHVKISYA